MLGMRGPWLGVACVTVYWHLDAVVWPVWPNSAPGGYGLRTTMLRACVQRLWCPVPIPMLTECSLVLLSSLFVSEGNQQKKGTTPCRRTSRIVRDPWGKLHSWQGIMTTQRAIFFLALAEHGGEPRICGGLSPAASFCVNRQAHSKLQPSSTLRATSKAIQEKRATKQCGLTHTLGQHLVEAPVRQSWQQTGNQTVHGKTKRRVETCCFLPFGRCPLTSQSQAVGSTLYLGLCPLGGCASRPQHAAPQQRLSLASYP